MWVLCKSYQSTDLLIDVSVYLDQKEREVTSYL